jgi:hypothetical protein
MVALAACYNPGMAAIVGIHGFAQQFRGGYQLGSVWYNALRDGLVAAGRRQVAEALAPADVRVVFFGDLFRSMALDEVPFSAADVRPGPEWDLLDEWYRAAVARDLSVDVSQGAMPAGRAGAEVMLDGLARSATFARIAQPALIGNLKRVTAFLTDPTLKQAALARVREQVSDDTRVVIAHSLGSVVAYEYLCRDQPGSVESLVTLGSPLGIPHVVFDRLSPSPVDGVGVWPAGACPAPLRRDTLAPLDGLYHPSSLRTVVWTRMSGRGQIQAHGSRSAGELLKVSSRGGCSSHAIHLGLVKLPVIQMVSAMNAAAPTATAGHRKKDACP